MTELSDAAMFNGYADAVKHANGNYGDTFYPDGQHGDSHEKSFADMIERLFRQFEDRLPLTTIVRVVRESRDQLRGSPAGAMPELTERLAAERLTTLSAAGLYPVIDTAGLAEPKLTSGTSTPRPAVVPLGSPAAVPALPTQV
ncbi:MAG: hypothetical protein ABI140_00070 [Jatrophihabitantaceae bacterium]